MPGRNILIYLIRKDMRVADNPVLHRLCTRKDHGFTHFLPVYVFPAHQIEVSGFITDSSDGARSPYPEARGRVSRFWRCGPHRAKFIAESVWDLKGSFESLQSGLVLRVGSFKDVVEGLLDGLKERSDKGAVWIAGEACSEEVADENTVEAACKKHGFGFEKLVDEKYFIDDRDLNFKEAQDLPEVFTEYRKSVEPLRERPRKSLPKPTASSLPPFPEAGSIPGQAQPFTIPDGYQELEEAVLRPLKSFFPNILPHAEKFSSAHPFSGGESAAHERLRHIAASGLLSSYKQTRNGLIGPEFSTKLSAYLAQGCITARQVHETLVGLEDGSCPELESVEGFGKGQTENTKAVREELMWRDYMRLYARKIGPKLFDVHGYKGPDNKPNAPSAEDQPQTSTSPATASPGPADDSPNSMAGDSTATYPITHWKTANPDEAQDSEEARKTAANLERYKAGTTGLGLIDASQRELLHTGYTSNRARQNTASFLSKHLTIDWRYGAEWYEMLLVDYDVCSNWGNWQYVAGVGFDPRGKARIFNPVKQAFDYDKEGLYVRMWLPELERLASLENVFQVCTTPADELEKAGLADNVMARDPVKHIVFNVHGKPPSARQQRRQAARGGHRGGGAGGSPKGHSLKSTHADGHGGVGQQQQTNPTGGVVNSTAAASTQSTPQPPRGPSSNRVQWRGPSRGSFHAGGGAGRAAAAGPYGGGPVNYGGGSTHRGHSFATGGGGGGSGWPRRGGPAGRAVYATTNAAPQGANGFHSHHGPNAGRPGAMVVGGNGAFVANGGMHHGQGSYPPGGHVYHPSGYHQPAFYPGQQHPGST